MGALASMLDMWDDHVRQWLDGGDDLAAPLRLWFDGYAGRGRGAVTRDGLAEPYIGDLTDPSRPRLVVLGLNPGAYSPAFQSRTGIFADEIRRMGSYRTWAATYPYTREPWTSHAGLNRYQRARHQFARSWLQDPGSPASDLLIGELYPWHSTAVTGPLRPDAGLIDTYLWQPLAELPRVEEVFAFGRPWADLANLLHLPEIDRLGAGGRPYGSLVPSRAIRVHALGPRQRLIVAWHSGSAGPPSRDESERLREALLG